jgi:hypothetical protein
MWRLREASPYPRRVVYFAAALLILFAERGWEADLSVIRPDETAVPTLERQLALTKLRLCGEVGQSRGQS